MCTLNITCNLISNVRFIVEVVRTIKIKHIAEKKTFENSKKKL